MVSNHSMNELYVLSVLSLFYNGYRGVYFANVLKEKRLLPPKPDR